MNDNQKVTSNKLNSLLRMDLQAAQIAIQASRLMVMTKMANSSAGLKGCSPSHQGSRPTMTSYLEASLHQEARACSDDPKP